MPNSQDYQLINNDDNIKDKILAKIIKLEQVIKKLESLKIQFNPQMEKIVQNIKRISEVYQTIISQIILDAKQLRQLSIKIDELSQCIEQEVIPLFTGDRNNGITTPTNIKKLIEAKLPSYQESTNDLELSELYAINNCQSNEHKVSTLKITSSQL